MAGPRFFVIVAAKDADDCFERAARHGTPGRAVLFDGSLHEVYGATEVVPASALPELIRTLEAGRYDARPTRLRQGCGTYLHDDGSPVDADELEALLDGDPVPPFDINQR